MPKLSPDDSVISARRQATRLPMRTSNSSHIVGLRRVGYAEVVGQRNALGREPGHVWVTGSLVVVGVLQPVTQSEMRLAHLDELL